MKIRKVLDKKVEGVEYHKFLITLPKDIVNESNFVGKDLKAKFENNRIIIEKDK